MNSIIITSKVFNKNVLWLYMASKKKCIDYIIKISTPSETEKIKKLQRTNGMKINQQEYDDNPVVKEIF